jgi:TatA/E family protein of Tat protein translocase
MLGAMIRDPSLAFLWEGLGPGELILIFLVVLVLFGPKRLPEISRMLGRAMSELRRASRDFHDQVMRIESEPDDKPPAFPGAPDKADPGADETIQDVENEDEVKGSPPEGEPETKEGDQHGLAG